MTNALLGELDQARVEANDQAMVDACGVLEGDYPRLVAMVERHGFQAVLSELSSLYGEKHPRMHLQWSMVSQDYRNGWFDGCFGSDEVF